MIKEKPKAIICKTTSRHGWTMVPTVIVLACLFIIGMFIIVFMKARVGQPEFLKYVLLLLGFIGLYFMVWRHVIAWFTAEFTVLLEGNILKGKNLWGRYTEIKIRDIVELRSRHFPSSYYFKCKNGITFEIDLHIDFYGFLMDKILEQTSIKDCNKGQLSKKRSVGAGWSYSRESPYNTEYSEGYLDWLRPQIEKQLKDLQEKGILKKDQNYIIQEPDNSKEKRRDEWANRSDI